MDRASDFESAGRAFESPQARHIRTKKEILGAQRLVVKDWCFGSIALRMTVLLKKTDQ